MRRSLEILGCCIVFGGLGCNPRQEVSEPTRTAPPVVSSPAPELVPAPASAVPIQSAAPTPSAAVSAPLPAASAAPETLPAVTVRNIGMHIGGGPNDAVSKRPIRDSVSPHFDAFRRCWSHVEDPKKPVDFGVDLLIEPAGGPAKVSAPRTAVKAPAFADCVVKVFEQVTFLKPVTGKTMVSYSLRFEP